MTMLTRGGLAGVLAGLLILIGRVGPGTVAAAPVGLATAQVRVVQAALDIPAVALYADEQRLIGDVGFKTVSALVPVSAGSQTLRLTLGDDGATAREVPLTAEAGQTYSLLVSGTKAEVGVKVLADDLSPVAAGQARVRAVHASPDTPAADVALQGGRVLFSNLGYTDVSRYQALPAATVDVALRPAGSATVVAAVPAFTLEAGKVYTVYAVGLSTGRPPVSLVAAVDAVGTTGSAAGSRGSGSLPPTGVPAGGLAWALLLGALGVLGSGVMLRRAYR